MADIVHSFCERSVNSVLDRIVAVHRRAAAEDNRPLGELERAALSAGPVRPFRAPLAAPGMSVIAEVKRRSPSKGDLAPGLVPAVLAAAYADGGADCLSVLTDAEFFGGSTEDLTDARAACDLPVLRKDFTVGEADVYDARAMGADAVLLIVAALSTAELPALRLLAHELEMAAVVEVHDEAELARALDAGAQVVGVNQRDLRTFEVDRARAERLAVAIPPGVVKVAESGIGAAQDVSRLAAYGFDAVLVGESLVTAPDPAAAVRNLKGTR
ncbi:MAG: indole-3-glycerol phosphate synthase TrpC [Acidimicrobiia bacterium]|nr:indole-3-glycerol phosphate synthase TrpC [Acidimicrobiia bacterium]